MVKLCFVVSVCVCVCCVVLCCVRFGQEQEGGTHGNDEVLEILVHRGRVRQRIARLLPLSRSARQPPSPPSRPAALLKPQVSFAQFCLQTHGS